MTTEKELCRNFKRVSFINVHCTPMKQIDNLIQKQNQTKRLKWLGIRFDANNKKYKTIISENGKINFRKNQDIHHL